MTNNINLCQIEVPTTLYNEPDSSQEDEILPYIILSFQVLETTDDDMFKHYLTPDEAQQLVAWLTDAIQFVNDTESSENQQENLQKSQLIILPVDNLAKGRLRLIGQLNFETENAIEPSIVVDVATDSNISSRWVRLLSVDEVITAYCFSSMRVKEVIDGLVDATEYLRQNPPYVISNLQIGTVEATASNGDTRWVEVEVEVAAYEVDAPRITLNIFENQCHAGSSSTWWFGDNEALKLALILSNAAAAVEQQRLEHIGDLGREVPGETETNPWLTVTVQQNHHSADANSLGVRICFDDELIQESENDGILWLTGNSAKHLSRVLLEAIEAKATHPPHIYVSPQPGNVVIADLSWA